MLYNVFDPGLFKLMKIIISVFTALILVIVMSAAGVAQKSATVGRQFRSVTWKIDNLKKIGGHPTRLLGRPQVIKTEAGKAILFDGVRDGIFLNVNPIAGAERFTIEAVFRPDAGGEKEQRWFHIEDGENTESRALLEIRLDGNEWFLDTFLKSGENRSPLYAENFKHKVGRWYTVALVFDGSEMCHYVNGIRELCGKLSIKPQGRGVTSIGVRQNKVYWFKGAVRKARFTNRALETYELMAIE